MASKPTTFRIDAPAQAALEHLSRVLKRPMNQLVNEAVKDYVDRRSREVERDLQGTIAKLRAYRQRDPQFERGIESVVDAEAQMGKNDPAQGKVVIGELVNGRLVEPSQAQGAGPVQAEVHRLLNAS
jgi:predicted transcriptional regulator